MDFQKLIETRYSVRAYSSKPVEKEKVEKVLHAAQMAPTAANRQPFHFIVIETKGRGEELGRIYHREWFSKAPLVICACADATQAWTRMDGKHYADVDTTIAMDHLILAAADLGLGTCWVAAFDPQAAREILHIPVALEPIAFTPLGYPKDSVREKKRKEIPDIVSYHQW